MTLPVPERGAPSAAPQPYAELGLADDEYARIATLLGRVPSTSELAMYAVMWSEHCSYKSSRVHLRRFGELPPSPRLLAGIGANAGVVAVGNGLAVTFKVESHNHPSYVEPYQGAATGVGGIVRDILAMGARPVAVMDSLRFGAADHPDSARVVPGVVAGVGGYGNCLGLPNIGGEVGFDPCYAGNPLVNALCLGVLPAGRLQTAAAAGHGNHVLLFGARTGRDGIGGVSVLASATFDETAQAHRPSVQVGDPFTEKLLIECTLELYDAGLVVGIQDLGGAGLACAISETAAAGRVGMTVALESVPLREASMAPWEVLTSESQERMLAVVAPERTEEALAICRRWGVLATVIGEVTDSGRLQVRWHGETVVDVPPASLAEEGPVYHRPMSRPAALDARQADGAERLARPRSGAEIAAAVLAVAASPDLADRSWVTEQYDRYVQGRTVAAAGAQAGVVRLDEETLLGVALSLDGPARFAALDPYTGAQLALAQACRNVAVSGAEPVAVTDCLNFGSPEDPEVMWTFAEAVRGLADGCRELGLPVTGGNVSFYNATGEAAIHPTPVIGVLGVIDDVTRVIPAAAPGEGAALLLLGETREELSGSVWAWVVHGHLGGHPPIVDLSAERRLGGLLIAAGRDGLIDAARDLAGGGLAQALVRLCLASGRGARVVLPSGSDPAVALFAESAARALVVVARSEEERFTAMCAARGVPCARLGVMDGTAMVVQDLFELSLEELTAAHRDTLPRLFG